MYTFLCRKHDDDIDEVASPGKFTRAHVGAGSFRASMRASVRGEIRSSMIQRQASVRSRRSMRGSSMSENAVV